MVYWAIDNPKPIEVTSQAGQLYIFPIGRHITSSVRSSN